MLSPTTRSRVLLQALLDLPLVHQRLTASTGFSLVEETNRYAGQVRSTVASPRARPCHDIDRDEMKAFVGMLMAMGLCKLPRLEMYWSTTNQYITPGLKKVMPLVVPANLAFLPLV